MKKFVLVAIGGTGMRVAQSLGLQRQALQRKQGFPLTKLLCAHALAQLLNSATQPEGENKGEAPLRLVGQFFRLVSGSSPLRR